MNQIDNYIQSFLNGSLGAEGHTVLRQWIKEKPENRYYFQAQVAIWKATGVISNAEEFDVTGAINRFNKKAKQVNRIDFYRCTLRFSVVAIILYNMRNFFLILFVAVGRESFRSCGRI